MSKTREVLSVYGIPFIVGWIYFINGILVVHPEFVEEYGWLAYQPFTFFVLSVTFTYAKAAKLGIQVHDKKITYSDARTKFYVFMIKALVVISLVSLFYVGVLGHKPNLLICL